MAASVGAFFRYGVARALRNALIVAVLPGVVWASDPARIVMLGDSLTAGFGLPEADGLAVQLDHWLNDNSGGLMIVNAGVSGDTTAGGRARLDWALADGAAALIVALGGNDILRGLPPEEARANLDAILTEADKRGLPVLLAGHQAPGNFGPEWQAGYDAIWPELAAAHNAVLVPDLLAPIRQAPEATRGALMQEDGIHPSAAGVALVVQALGPKVIELAQRIK